MSRSRKQYGICNHTGLPVIKAMKGCPLFAPNARYHRQGKKQRICANCIHYDPAKGKSYAKKYVVEVRG
jgi:hypothetical protein